MDIGTHLQEHRIRRGIALSEIARSTKLSTMTLHYIERNDFDRLPGGIFIRGYLRAFAAAVGANPDDVIRAYVELFPAEPAAEEPPSLRDVVTAHRRFAAGLAAAVLSIVLALAAYGVFSQTSDPPPAASPALLEARPIDPFVARAIAAGAAPAQSRPMQGLHLEIQATEKRWVSARADGRLVVHRFIESGERVIVDAVLQVILQVDRGEGFVYTLNGEPGRPLGGPTTPVTVRITEQNLATFQTGFGAELLEPGPGSTT